MILISRSCILASQLSAKSVVLYSWALLSCPFYKHICLFRGFTGGQKNEDVKQDKDDVLNIFSVASGHLYERFLRLVQNL